MNDCRSLNPITLQIPEVFIIIVNWNGLHHLETCLPSVMETRFVRYRVLVVDNGSCDNSVSFVKHHFSSVQLIQNVTNVGFAEGNNIGIRYALQQGADYVVLLNNDTRVEPDWLGELIEAVEGDPQIGIAECQQRSWDGQQVIRLRFRPDWMEGVEERTPLGATMEPISPVAYAAGCCALLRSETLRHIGFFDPRYFAYVEDVDLSLRAWIAGYKVITVPKAVIYHRVGGSSESRSRMYLGYHNQLYTLLKNYETGTLWHFRRSIGRRWLLTRNRVALSATLKVLTDAPRILNSRKEVQRLRERTDREIFALAGIEW